MSTTPKKRPSKKINNQYILWFEESNSWIQLEEPAWYVYNQFNAGTSTDNISLSFSRRFKLPIAESLAFVSDIISQIEKLSAITFQPTSSLVAEKYESPKDFFLTRIYRIKQKIFEIAYATSRLEHTIHPSFAHLETTSKSKPYFRIEVFNTASTFVLKIANKAWAQPDPNFLKRKLFIELTSLIYGKTENDWLSFIHGSAVTNGKESIILSTACGSGKSTLAALLCAGGLQFVSDDYVPVDARFCKAYPFPAALSVKDGAYPSLLPLYNELKDAEVYHFKGTNKTVRYLPFPAGKDFFRPLPIKNIVFVQYDATGEFSFRKVPAVEAIKRFNEEAWLSPTPAHARKFIKWFHSLNCYELVYSDNAQAIQSVKQLFGKP